MEALLPGHCRFHGFLNQSALPALYRRLDLLILPSIQGEVWGLVVNEALSLGARVVVSDRVGCRHDLVPDPRAGWVFRAGDPRSLAEALALALEAWPWPRSACLVPEPRELVDAVRRYRIGGEAKRP
jgi:glycosyltransferase involved in cell wall biosynthesis